MTLNLSLYLLPLRYLQKYVKRLDMEEYPFILIISISLWNYFGKKKNKYTTQYIIYNTIVG